MGHLFTFKWLARTSSGSEDRIILQIFEFMVLTLSKIYLKESMFKRKLGELIVEIVNVMAIHFLIN